MYYGDPWEILGIAQTRDTREIRRAYAARLKVTHPEDDAEGFKSLRAAYEVALNIANALVAADDDAQHMEQPDIGAAVHRDASAPHEPSPASATDLLALSQQRTLTDLRDELHAVTPLDRARAEKLLSEALGADRMERFDLMQRTEIELGEIFAATTPRSDALLATTEKHFEWTHRLGEQSLPRGARWAVARLSDMWILKDLERGRTEEAAAYARLAGPARPLRRFMRAHFIHSASWPEIDLIAKLEREHPALLEGLPAENVEWWQRFHQQTKFSMATAILGIFIGFALVIATVKDSEGAPAMWLIPLCAVVAPLFRWALVDWPITLVARRWYPYPPHWFRLGWLPAVIVLMFAGALAAPVPWLGWVITTLAVIAAFWARYTVGRTLPIFHADGIRLQQSPLIRSFFINILVIFWLGLTTADLGDIFSEPFVLTIIAAMAASGIAREVKAHAFQFELSGRVQFLSSLALCGISLLVGYLLLIHAADSTWQLLLVVAVMTCLMLRRVIHPRIQTDSVTPYLGLVVVVFLVIALRAYADSRSADGLMVETGALVTGGLFMLSGVIVSALRWIYLMHEDGVDFRSA